MRDSGSHPYLIIRPSTRAAAAYYSGITFAIISCFVSKACNDAYASSLARFVSFASNQLR